MITRTVITARPCHRPRWEVRAPPSARTAELTSATSTPFLSMSGKPASAPEGS